MSIILDLTLILTLINLNVLIGYFALIKRDAWRNIQHYNNEEDYVSETLANLWEDKS